MDVKVELTKAYKKKMTRAGKVPQGIRLLIESYALRKAVKLRNIFREGILGNELDLEPLKPRTISRKSLRGFPEPKVPLHGLGEGAEGESLSDALGIRKLENGYQVLGRTTRHWDRSRGKMNTLTLRSLHLIHELGNPSSNLPARPALAKAKEQFDSEEAQEDRDMGQEVKMAMVEYINKGTLTLAKKYRDMNREGAAEVPKVGAV